MDAVRIQTQELESRAQALTTRLCHSCGLALWPHQDTELPLAASFLPRGCAAVSGQWSKASGHLALPVFVPGNYLSSEQLGISPKTDPCQRQLTNSHRSESRVGLWHGLGAGGKCGWDNEQQADDLEDIFSPALQNKPQSCHKGLVLLEGKYVNDSVPSWDG